MKRTKRIKYDWIRLIMLLMALIPLVDTLNGYLLKGGTSSVGIGVLYRLLFLVVILIYIIKDKITKVDIFVIAEFVLFLVIQLFVSERSYLSDSIETTIKMFTPMFMICAFIKMRRRSKVNKRDFDSLLDKLSLLFPLTILVPYALHIGYSTYTGGVGYKAFYYATNEISFSICVMIMYLWQKIRKEFSTKHLVLILFNATSCVLIGSKISIGVMILFTAFLVLESLYVANKKKIGRSIGTILFIGVAFYFVLNRFSDSIERVVNRWNNNLRITDSGITFLFSHRNVFLSNGYKVFASKGLLTVLFGWGIGGKNNNGLVFVEMDFFDVLFGTGIVGLIFVLLTYITLIKKLNIRSKIGWIFIFAAFLLSFVGGHIIFTGLGGMMLAILCMYSSLIEKDSNQVHECNVKRGKAIA